MKYLAEVSVMPLPELLDPQGKAVSLGLGNLGIKGVKDVRVGKKIHLEVEANSLQEAETKVNDACKKLLANPIMEGFQFTIQTLN